MIYIYKSEHLSFLKKASIIFSLILIVVFSTSSFFIHKCYLHSYKQAYKAYIFQNKQHTIHTTTIQINPSELFANSSIIQWEDENKEIVYKSELYDIIKIENKNGKVILTTVSDTQETELKKQFALSCYLDSNSKSKIPFELLKNFFALKCIINHAIINLQLFPISNSLSTPCSKFQLPSVFQSKETPPPDFFA